MRSAPMPNGNYLFALQTRMETFSAEKLKGFMQEQGLPSKGRKEQMVARLKQSKKGAGAMRSNGRTRSAA
jgi:hypothetical protein